MKTSHLLLLAAASIAPLQAATPEANALTLPASNALQLAASNNSLASIAAGNDFLSLYNIPANTEKLVALGLFKLTAEDLAVQPFRSITIAANMAELSKQCQALQEPSHIAPMQDLLSKWAEAANPTYAAALAQLAQQTTPEADTIKALQDYIANTDLSPIYISAEIQGEMMLAAPLLFSQLPALAKNMGDGITCTMTGNKAQLSIPAAILLNAQENSLPSVVASELGKKTILVDIELKGKLLNIAIGTNPANFKWADNLEQSVLASEASKYMDSPLNSKGFLSTSLSAASINDMAQQSAAPLATALGKTFSDLALAVPADAAKLNAAADSAEKLAAGIIAISADTQQDISIIMALDKALQAEIKFPMLGEYATSKMNALSSINDKSIALMQSSGMAMNFSSLPKLQALIPDLMVVSDALQMTMTPESSAQFMPALNVVQSLLTDSAPQADPMVNMVMGTLKAFEPSCLKLLNSMGTSYGLSYELGATPEDDESVVAFAEIANKQQWLEGVDEFYQTANNFATSFGFTLPIGPAQIQEGATTTYTFDCEPIQLQAQLSDSCLSISNAPAANQAMQAAMAAAAGPAVKGAVFYLDFKNAAPYIKELCDDDEDFAAYEAMTKPFTSALIIMQNDEPTGTKGSIRITLPLK